ncbi:MAG: rhodanese-like domain-containing protein [Acidimicrobiales bacterium]
MNDDAVPSVDVGRAATLLRADAVLLDVREPEEFVAGRAENAVAIPIGELALRTGELSKDDTIILVCRTGSRSALATVALNAAGFHAFNLEGGMVAWQDANLPVVSDAGPGIVI